MTNEENQLNPKQLFVISTISRKDIAGLLNRHLKPGITRFKWNDPRLTDSVCESIAQLIHEYDDNQSYDEFYYTLKCELDELVEGACDSAAKDAIEQF
jgi:hypothetical protein